MQDKLIALYVLHKSCPNESRVIYNNNGLECMIKIVLDSKKRHNVERTDHADTGLAHSYDY